MQKTRIKLFTLAIAVAISLQLVAHSATAEQLPRHTALEKGIVCNEKEDIRRFLSNNDVAMSLTISGRCMGLDGSGVPVQGEILDSEPFGQAQIHKFQFIGPAGGGIVWAVGYFNPPITPPSLSQENNISDRSTSEEGSISQSTKTFESSDYIVRIRPTHAGGYEYSSWSAGSRLNSAPDMVISDGRIIPDGSGGNYYYSFSNGNYTYNVHIIALGTSSSPDGRLEVLNGDDQIMSQDLHRAQ